MFVSVMKEDGTLLVIVPMEVAVASEFVVLGSFGSVLREV
jgi:hypothetical protein